VRSDDLESPKHVRWSDGAHDMRDELSALDPGPSGSTFQAYGHTT